MRTSHRLIALGACAVAIVMSVVGSASAAEPFWRVEESQNPTETTANVLRDVACPQWYAPTQTYACIGVGNSTPTSGGSRTLIEIGGSGTVGWFPYPGAPSFSEGGVLEAISCPIETVCMAVGYYSPKSGVRRPLAAHFNGFETPEWKFEKPSIPGTDEFTELNGISCTSATSCEAVGTTSATSGTTASKTLAEKWNGSTWSVQTTFNTVSENHLTDVSCTSSTWCMAVGRFATSTLSEVYNGTEWKQAGLSSSGLFESVSCSAANTCTAVGQFNKAIIARRWTGSGWAPQSVVVPSGSTLSIGSDVNCLTATECVAVGSYTSGGVSNALAEHWNGTTWSQDSVPAPKGSSAASFLGVTCRAAALCSAVGNQTSSGIVKTLAEVYR